MTDAKRQLGVLSAMKEAGMWILIVEERLHTSEIFIGESLYKLDTETAMSFLKDLIETNPVDNGNAELTDLILVHTHPGSGSALSYNDVALIVSLAKQAEDITATVMATPLGDNGKLVFTHSSCSK